jgi:hypothetical protein
MDSPRILHRQLLNDVGASSVPCQHQASCKLYARVSYAKAPTVETPKPVSTLKAPLLPVKTKAVVQDVRYMSRIPAAPRLLDSAASLRDAHTCLGVHKTALSPTPVAWGARARNHGSSEVGSEDEVDSPSLADELMDTLWLDRMGLLPVTAEDSIDALSPSLCGEFTADTGTDVGTAAKLFVGRLATMQNA